MFESAACSPPVGEDYEVWAKPWVNPETVIEVRVAERLCLTECPALDTCRALLDVAPYPPSGVVQAGVAFVGVRSVQPVAPQAQQQSVA